MPCLVIKMKINEIIVESYKTKEHGKAKSLPSDIDSTLPGIFVQRQLRNTDPYMQYRYGLAVAAARAHAAGDIEYNQETAFAENFTQVLYAKEDEETIKLASKLMGVTPTQIADTRSYEDTNINSTSPVAKPKRNKYGV